MTRKVAVITVEYDDADDKIKDATHLATYVQQALYELPNLDITVYPTPADLLKDIEDGIGAFGCDNKNPGQPIVLDQDADFVDTVKPI